VTLDWKNVPGFSEKISQFLTSASQYNVVNVEHAERTPLPRWVYQIDGM
jgi:hypothetical protein